VTGSPNLVFGSGEKEDIITFRLDEATKRRFTAHHISIDIVLISTQRIYIIIDTFTLKHQRTLGISLTGSLHSQRLTFYMKPVSRKTGSQPTAPEEITVAIVINKRFSVNVIYDKRTIHTFRSRSKKPVTFSKTERTIRTISYHDIRTHLFIRFHKGDVEVVSTVLLNHLSGSPITEITSFLLPFVIHPIVAFRPVEALDVRAFEAPVHKIFRFPYDRSSGTSKSVIQIGSAIKIIGITKFGDRRIRQIIGNKRIIVPVGNQ